MDCPDCEGEGTVLRKKCRVDGIEYPAMVVNCWRCDGSGELCDACGESVAVCKGYCRDEDED